MVRGGGQRCQSIPEKSRIRKLVKESLDGVLEEIGPSYGVFAPEGRD